MTALSTHDATVQVPVLADEPASPVREGDVINLQVSGVRVTKANGQVIAVQMPNGQPCLVDLRSGAVTFTLAEPAHWPPQRGDVWIDRDGNPWFGAHIDDHTYLVSEDGSDQYINTVVGSHGPLTLAFRDGKAVQP